MLCLSTYCNIAVYERESVVVSMNMSTTCPYVVFHTEHTEHTDNMLVRHGDGLKSTRIADGHGHEYVNLAMHVREEPAVSDPAGDPAARWRPAADLYRPRCCFVQVLEGEAIYRDGQNRFTLRSDDCISVDAGLNHGFIEVLTPEFVFPTVQDERR